MKNDRRRRIHTHLLLALEGELAQGERLTAATSIQGTYWPFIVKTKILWLVVTDQRLLIVKLDQRVPARNLFKVTPGTVTEQRRRRPNEKILIPRSMAELDEPGLNLGSNIITVDESWFTPGPGWHFDDLDDTSGAEPGQTPVADSNQPAHEIVDPDTAPRSGPEVGDDDEDCDHPEALSR